MNKRARGTAAPAKNAVGPSRIWPRDPFRVPKTATKQLPKPDSINPQKRTHTRSSWKKKMGFLDLPAEIRNVIYRLVLVYDGIDVDFDIRYTGGVPTYAWRAATFRIQSMTVDALSTRHSSEEAPPKVLRMLFPKLANGPGPPGTVPKSILYHAHKSIVIRKVPVSELTALLKTCRQVCLEARGIFWGENVFITRYTQEQSYFILWLDRHHLKHLVRRLGVMTSCYEKHRYDEAEDEAADQVLYSRWWSQGPALSDYGSCRWLTNIDLLQSKNKKPYSKEDPEGFTRPWDKGAMGRPRGPKPNPREGYNPFTGLPTEPPAPGQIRSGSIFDPGTAEVSAGLNGGQRTSLDILEICLRYWRQERIKGWRLRSERFEWHTDWYREPLWRWYLWTEKTDDVAQT
ncbi:MAG: hypothetical protein Q9218_006378 [Villophora microphyllina]